ncbi:MAG: DNA-methyltransferase [Promethearchaeota archaeon]
MKSIHRIFFKNSGNMQEIDNDSIDLVVTSPPYPMIELWDNLFSELNLKIRTALEKKNGNSAFELMHNELNKIWDEVYRVLKNGGFLCVNIGDATRKIGNSFQLFPNHAKVINYCMKLGFKYLPEILWRKRSNKPNKFMGSGMLPPNAYATQEHEYILIFRKNGLRKFGKEELKTRRSSSYFWEERNKWFSDIWEDLKGINQKSELIETRNRTAAYPFELAYRLINMFSIQGDTILDPFLGSGTTILASIASNRHSIGYELDKSLNKLIKERMNNIIEFSNNYIIERIYNHLIFIRKYKNKGKKFKYYSGKYKFEVITGQETNIKFYFLKKIRIINENVYEILYYDDYNIDDILKYINKVYSTRFFIEDGTIEHKNPPVQSKLRF